MAALGTYIRLVSSLLAFAIGQALGHHRGGAWEGAGVGVLQS
jgi:hypothetical protein